MRVLLDIASVGPGNSYGPESRTGIFRVFESLAYELAASPECDLSLCASGSTYHAYAYARSNPRLAGVTFPYASHKQTLSATLDRINKTQEVTTSMAVKATLRGTRKALWLLDNAIGSSPQPIEPASLAQADVYHSTFQCLPSQAKKKRNLARFLTVYDLIPIKHPEFLGPNSAGTDEKLKKILEA